MPAERVDGNDVLAVRQAVVTAVARARRGDGPTFVEALTYRQKGHSRTDPGAYRPAGELEQWLERDPIAVLEAALVDLGSATPEQLEHIRADTQVAVREATERALAWPDPLPEERFEDVFA
jgi:acetoin:2,6-dichlorophenolindophenol oxidoreductase subunit alpha